jgi:GT2 family glycosyltransferase
MKYSILIPYHKRPTLQATLKSFSDLYASRNDYEIVIVESQRTYNDQNNHNGLLSILNEFTSKLTIKLSLNKDDGYSCAPAYNQAFKNSSGEFIIITNPESPHIVNILSELDKIFEQNKNTYVVCSCLAVNENGSPLIWYQHSIYNNRRLHFCSAISRQNWLKTNGFCEAYSNGAAFEDDDFLERVKLLNIPIITRDDLVVYHIEHPREYLSVELDAINRQLYNFIWDKKR